MSRGKAYKRITTKHACYQSVQRHNYKTCFFVNMKLLSLLEVTCCNQSLIKLLWDIIVHTIIMFAWLNFES